MTVAQIYAINPSTTVNNTDLFYLVQSPYTPGTDSAILGSDLKTAFGQGTVTSITAGAGLTGGTITTSGTIALAIPVTATDGGTGVVNPGTITVGGNVTFSGAFTFTGIITGNTSVTFPTLGTLATTAQLLASPLTTKGDLWGWSTTNARLPVGTTNGQVLQVASGATLGLAYSTATYPTTATDVARILRSDGTNWVETTSTFADTYAASSILYANGANNVAGLTTANNGIILTSGTGVPSIATTFGQGLAVASSVLSVGGANNIPFNTGKGIQDSNGNPLLLFTTTASAVNYLTIKNAATGNKVLLDMTGTDSTIDFDIRLKNGDFYLSDSTGTKAPILKLSNAAGSHAVGLRAATALAGDPNFVLPSVDGAANSAMITDGSGNLSFGKTTGVYIGTQVLTSGTTYTPTTGTKTIHGRMLGGAGGSAGNGTGSPTNGGNGGDTTFNSSAYIAKGGGGAATNGLPGAPGVAGTIVSATTDFTSSGIGGTTGFLLVTGGLGGSTFLGGGGRIVGGGGAAIPGLANTGGGAGGCGPNGANNGGAGAGSGGYTEFWKSNISGTYTYAIGTAGTAGNAGTGGLAGAIGGTGIIIIDEYS